MEHENSELRKWRTASLVALLGFISMLLFANHFQSEAQEAEERFQLQSSRVVALEDELAIALSAVRKATNEANEAKSERDAAISNASRLERESGICQVALSDTRDDAAELRERLYVRDSQIDYVVDRWNWCKRDRKAAQCALGNEPGCDNPSKVDYGGTVNE